LQENEQMVWSIDPRREALRKIHWPLWAAGVFGTRVAETILASGHVRPPPTGRTYDRKRSDQNTAKNPCKEGAVHIWILLRHSADWRWLLNRDDNPWYPTARLFRQHRPGDWDGVVADVSRALQAVARR